LELNHCFREHDRNRLTVTLAPVAMLDPEGVQPLKRGFESGTLKAVEFAVVYLAAGGKRNGGSRTLSLPPSKALVGPLSAAALLFGGSLFLCRFLGCLFLCFFRSGLFGRFFRRLLCRLFLGCRFLGGSFLGGSLFLGRSALTTAARWSYGS